MWTSLTSRLGRIEGSITFTWPELETLVGGLPDSAARHRAWWSGDRTHVNAWRRAGFTVTNLEMGRQVTFTRQSSTTTVKRTKQKREAGDSSDGPTRSSDIVDRHASKVHVDVLLVTCVKRKRSTPAAAKDLYISDLFLKERLYAERLGVPWFIVSAERGLVAPEEWVSPYERYLPDTPTWYQTAWAAWVAARLELLSGRLHGKTVEIHASRDYLDAIRPHLERRGARVIDPLHGLTQGQRLAWYTKQIGAEYTSFEPTNPRRHTVEIVEQVAGALLDESTAITPDQLLGVGGAGLDHPGLYSWWVDADGAVDLAAGLGLPVKPGLIYAGLAGATRWPSGQASTNTLWSRLTKMHLAGNHEFSTFRRTLAAILSRGDPDRVDETALTTWMHAHLRVITVIYDDADTLRRLEQVVLDNLNPPLNLQGMPPTAIRTQLTALRRKIRSD